MLAETWGEVVQLFSYFPMNSGYFVHHSSPGSQDFFKESRFRSASSSKKPLWSTSGENFFQASAGDQYIP